jgi:hypothetical protein
MLCIPAIITTGNGEYGIGQSAKRMAMKSLHLIHLYCAMPHAPCLFIRPVAIKKSCLSFSELRSKLPQLAKNQEMIFFL